MTSHEYAKRLVALGEWLLARDDFEAGHVSDSIDFFLGDKEAFLKAVRACGSGTKRTSGDIFVFKPNTPEGTKLELNISRNKVCKLIRPAEYECEPLLSQDEVDSIAEQPA